MQVSVRRAITKKLLQGCQIFYSNYDRGRFALLNDLLDVFVASLVLQ